MTNSFRTGALVVAAALAGGVTAYAVDSTHSDTRTIIRTASPAATTVSAPPQQGLSVNQIYRKDAPGVVVVTATTTTTTSNQFDPFGAPQQQQAQALGSGFVIDKSGHILTNAHVVLNASKVQVAFGADATSRTYDAKVLGIDRSTDVAVLKVDAPAEALTPLALGNSSDVQVGDPVVAIGNPLGEARTATTGIVSAVNRDIGSLQGNVQIRGAIQTDAAINHGNSGGPLINDEGQVIGITSQILSDDPNNPQSGSIGIGFAVPINTVKTVADQIITSGKAQHTYLGILGSEITPNLAQALNLGVDHGVLIGKVESGSPAAMAGLKAGTTQATIQGQTMTLGGDIITSIDGKQIHTFDDLSGGIAAKKAGDTVQLGIYRDGKQSTVTVTLAAR
ncbi:MAG TPA: trypsin-like peptidase domain-containing protein [Gaiellales bacterium]|nr:trypsin-like peptidase domain-containing protein [Gaiellales bacterium]